MPDIFISYSRRNKAFVQNLDNALRSQDKDIWIDWEDIPPTVDFIQEIYQGIDNSNAFIVVLSPDYLASKYCLLELERAVALNKRLLPVVCIDVTPDTVPQHIRNLNWIFARETDDFEQAVTTLLTAFETDYEYLREHTRYTLRALEWESESRDNSFLLKGKELIEAEAWFTQGLERDSKPTTLQADFISASRVVENRRQRTLLIGVSVALVVSLALAVLSFLLYGQSEDRRVLADNNAATAIAAEATAVRESDLSHMLNLASNGQLSAINGNNDLALILALTANQLDNPPAQAQRVLFDLAYAPGTRLVLPGHHGTVNRVAYTPDGNRLIATAEGEITIWDVANGKILHRWNAHHDTPITALAITSNGSRFVTGGEDGELIIWDSESAEEVLAFAGHLAPITDIDITSDGKTLLSASVDRTVKLWDLETGEEIYQIEADEGSIWAATFSPDGTYFATGGDEGVVRVWETESGDLASELMGHADIIWDLNFGQDNSILASASDDLSVILWDLNNHEAVQELNGHLLGIWAVTLHPDGQRVISGSIDTSIYIWDAVLGTLIQRLGGHTSAITALDISPDGQHVASASGDRTVRIWDINNGLQTGFIPPDIASNFGIQFDRAGERVVTMSLTETDAPAIIMRSYAAGEPGAVLQGFGDEQSVVWAADLSPDGKYVLSAAADFDLVLWDTESGQEIRRMRNHEALIAAIKFSPSGQRAASVDGEGLVTIWDIESGDIEQQWIMPNSLNGVNFTPDEQRVVLGDIDGRISEYDVHSGDLIREYPFIHNGGVYAFKYTTDGSRLLSGSTDSTLILWDTATTTLLYQMRGHRAPVLNIDISPDNQLALSGGSDAIVILWDMVTGTEIRRFSGHSGGVFGVAFAPDGEFAASTSVDGTARFWRIEQPLEEVIAWAQANRYLRDLTCVEHEFYHIEPTCAEVTPEPTP